jgi:hypothetical protein
VLRGCWRNTIAVNVHAPSDESKESFYVELEKVFDHFLKYMKMLLGDFNAGVGRENIFKPTIGEKSLHQDSNDNGVRLVNLVRLVNFATSENLVVKSTMFPHRNIQNHTWTSPDGKTHNQIDHILIDRRWQSSVLDVLSNVLLSRLIPYAEEIVGDHQCGFRRDRSTIHHIFCIRQILEKKWKFNEEVHQLFNRLPESL